MAAQVRPRKRAWEQTPDPAEHPPTRISRSYRAQAQDRGWLSRKNYLWLLIALLVGWGVRVNALDAQSLWNDEGTSVALAQRSLEAIANAAARDIHPPLYYFLLHFWILVGGISEFELRFLSVGAGILLVAVTFRIAREFFDEDVALIASILAALNAFQVYYAQEARMYLLVALWSALSVWAMARLVLSHAGIRRLVTRDYLVTSAAYFLAMLAALYTQYYAVTIVLFENVAFVIGLVWAGRSQRQGSWKRPLALWIASQLLLLVAFVPWLLFARASILSWPAVGEQFGILELVQRLLSAFALAIDQPLDSQAYLLVVYAIFFIGGLVPSRDMFRQSAYGIVLAALWTLIPILTMYVVSLERPAYNPKFLLLATPGFLVLVARGVSVLYPGLFIRERYPAVSVYWSKTKRLALQVFGIGKLFVGAALAVGLILALEDLSTDPRLQRDDYRSIVNYINAVATDRDVVIVDAPGQMDVFRYYYQGKADVQALPIGRPADRDATLSLLNDMENRYHYLFGVLWATEQADPTRIIEDYFANNAFKAKEDWFGNVRLAQYALRPAFDNAYNPNEGFFRFGPDLRLEQYGIGGRVRGENDLVFDIHAGQLLPLRFIWRDLRPVNVNYKVFVHLLDANGQIVSQRDYVPVEGIRPTSTWKPKQQEVSDQTALYIFPGTPPGDYTIIMGMYDPDTGERLPITPNQPAGYGSLLDDNRLLLYKIHINKSIAPRASLLFVPPLHWNLDAIQLIGYNLDRRQFTPGEFVQLRLYWQAREKPSSDLRVNIQLLDVNNNILTTSPGFALYPTTLWESDEIVRDVHTLIIPPNAPPGEYRIVATDGTQTQEVVKIQVKIKN